MLVVLWQALHALELLQQFAVFELRLNGFAGGTFEQVVTGNTEYIGQPLQGIARGARSAALIAANVRVVQLCELPQLGLRQILALAQLTQAQGKAL